MSYANVTDCLGHVTNRLEDVFDKDSYYDENLESILLNLQKWMEMSDVEMQIHLPESTERERLSIRAILNHISSGNGMHTFRKPL